MLLLMVPMGTASVLFIATANSLLQLHSSDAMRGRVMALWAMVFLGSTPIGGPLTGVAVAHFGVRLTMAFGGVATLLTAAAAGFALRRIRGEGRAARAVAAREARLVIGAAGSSL
jgi:MFS family permease